MPTTYLHTHIHTLSWILFFVVFFFLYMHFLLDIFFTPFFALCLSTSLFPVPQSFLNNSGEENPWKETILRHLVNLRSPLLKPRLIFFLKDWILLHSFWSMKSSVSHSEQLCTDGIF